MGRTPATSSRGRAISIAFTTSMGTRLFSRVLARERRRPARCAAAPTPALLNALSPSRASSSDDEAHPAMRFAAGRGRPPVAPARRAGAIVAARRASPAEGTQQRGTETDQPPARIEIRAPMTLSARRLAHGRPGRASGSGRAPARRRPRAAIAALSGRAQARRTTSSSVAAPAISGRRASTAGVSRAARSSARGAHTTSPASRRRRPRAVTKPTQRNAPHLLSPPPRARRRGHAARYARASSASTPARATSGSASRPQVRRRRCRPARVRVDRPPGPSANGASRSRRPAACDRARLGRPLLAIAGRRRRRAG